MGKIVNEGSSSIAVALKNFLRDYCWLGLARTTPWDIPNDPPMELYSTRAQDIQEILGIKKIEVTSMVKPDGLGEIQFYGQNYSLITEEEAILGDFPFAYCKTILAWDQEFPIIDFYQLFLCVQPNIKSGFENRTFLIPRPLVKGTTQGPFTFGPTNNSIRFSVNDGIAQTIQFEEGTFIATIVAGYINQQLHASGNYQYLNAHTNDNLIYLEGRSGTEKIEIFDTVNACYDILGWPVPTTAASYVTYNQLTDLGRLLWYDNLTGVSRHQTSREIVEFIFEVPTKAD